jgi:hypothetical protein
MAIFINRNCKERREEKCAATIKTNMSMNTGPKANFIATTAMNIATGRWVESGSVRAVG